MRLRYAAVSLAVAVIAGVAGHALSLGRAAAQDTQVRCTDLQILYTCVYRGISAGYDVNPSNMTPVVTRTRQSCGCPTQPLSRPPEIMQRWTTCSSAQTHARNDYVSRQRNPPTVIDRTTSANWCRDPNQVPVAQH